MMTYVCDKCLTNRSDQGEMYHLTITKVETGKQLKTKSIVNEIDICKPCFDKMIGVKK